MSYASDQLKKDVRYPLIPLKENLNRLPVGVETTDGDVLRDIQFRDLSREDLKMIRNESYARNHPIGWLARTASLVTESIGGESVYSLYKSSNYKKLPDVIKEVPIQDIYFILVAGHIHNFGTTIPHVKGRCPNDLCQREQTFDLDIEEVEVEYEEKPCHDIEVVLKDGIVIPDPETEQEITFHYLKFKAPTVKDCIRNEEFYRPNNQGPYQEKVYASACQEVRSDEGITLDRNQILKRSQSLFTNLSARDSETLDEELNAIPSLHTAVIQECQYCSEDMPIFIPKSFLFQKPK